LGETILPAHVDQHFGNGAATDSLAAENTSAATTSRRFRRRSPTSMRRCDVVRAPRPEPIAKSLAADVFLGGKRSVCRAVAEVLVPCARRMVSPKPRENRCGEHDKLLLGEAELFELGRCVPRFLRTCHVTSAHGCAAADCASA